MARRRRSLLESSPNREMLRCDSDQTVRLLSPSPSAYSLTDGSAPLNRLPTIAVGEHLASNLGRTSSVRSELEEFPARSRYLTYSHVIYGPELIHVGDFVRLKPGSDLGPFIDRKGFDPKHQLLATTLILHISIIYQGLGRSPLMARGVIYELVEMPDREDPNYALNPQDSPSPFPFSQVEVSLDGAWRSRFVLLGYRGSLLSLDEERFGRIGIGQRRTQEIESTSRQQGGSLGMGS